MPHSADSMKIAAFSRFKLCNLREAFPDNRIPIRTYETRDGAMQRRRP